MAIVHLFGLALTIGGGRNDDQSKRTLAGSALPVHALHLFIANLAAFSAIEELGRFPCARLLLTDLFGGELLGGIEAARIRWSAKAQPGIFASSGHEDRAFRDVPKAGTVAEAAIAGQHQHLVAAAGLIQFF